MNSSIMIFSFTFTFILYFTALISGQVQYEGRYNAKARQIYFGKRVDSGMNDSKFKVQVPFHDSKTLLSLDESQKASNSVHSAPISFAKAIPVKIDFKEKGIWEKDGDYRTWTCLIESKTALGLALIFEEFRIINEGELYIVNDSGFLGAFTSKNNKKDGKFSIQPISGASIFLIFIEPLRSLKPLNSLIISKVVHVYRDLSMFTSQKLLSGSCNVDVKCVNSFNDQKRATIVFMTDQLQKFCTGVMINNARGDGRQLLLTANHCVFTDLSNSIAGFNYERLGCSLDSQVSNPRTAHGMKLLARASTSDFALFEVIEKIPRSYSVFMSGWDANVPNLNLADTFAGIHHPSGDVKKISLYSGKIQLTSWSEGPTNQYHIAIPKWSRGVTEPGSSGSPLFNSKGSLIGQLHGGASSCSSLDGSDLYGGFAFSFGSNGSGISLKTILDPNGVVKSLVLPGRNLYSNGSSDPPTSTSVISTVTSTVISTVTRTVSNCQCIPKDIVDKLINSYENRIKLLE